MKNTSPPPASVKARLLLAAASILLAAALVEAYLALALRFPVLCGPALNAVRRVYADDRDIVQFDPECASYDPGIGYTLRPGACSSSSPEFKTTLRVNSAGLRDDEASLASPQVIVLGDSFAMGWGVEQDEAFPQRLEAELGVPVLNAGVSSYGTLREMIMLRRLDTSKLRTLVIQYCDNDAQENAAIAGPVKMISREAYLDEAMKWKRNTMYYPGKYLRAALSREAAAPPLSAEDEAGLFLGVLAAVPPPGRGLNLIVLETNGYGRNDARFAAELLGRLRRTGLPPWAGSVTVLDLSKDLGEGDYFILDDHLNAGGHRRVAGKYLEVVRSLQRTHDRRHS